MIEKTDPKFWSNFWGRIKLPQTVDYSFKNDRVIAETIKQYVPVGFGESWAAEIGCAPGKWLAFLNRELRYKVHGYEYIPEAVEKTRENLKLCGVDEFEIFQSDFLKLEPSFKYDCVLSLGFIEHFKNYDEIFRKHIRLVKQGGYLVIGLPNFTGINFFIQSIVDLWLTEKLLPAHELQIMNRKILKKLGNDNGLCIKHIEYIGGFEPALFNINAIKNPIIYWITKKIFGLCTRFFYHTKCSFFSSYLLAIYKNDKV